LVLAHSPESNPAILNRILSSVPASGLDLLRGGMTRVPIVRDQVLADYEQRDDQVFFIERGVVSIISEPIDDEGGIQVAMVGREGMVGSLSLVEMQYAAPVQIVASIPGTALRVSGSILRQALCNSVDLHEACVRFTQSLTGQIMQTATCHARRNLAERCARWLVMTLDRVDGSEIRVTHEALGAMLGMRRSGVTVAAASLQEAGLIRTGRGRFIIVNPARLRHFAQGTLADAATTSDGERARPRSAVFGIGSGPASVSFR
jgi:CRP-like cAMP-binding protein